MHWKSALKPTLPNLTSPLTMDKGFKCANVCFIATVEKGRHVITFLSKIILLLKLII